MARCEEQRAGWNVSSSLSFCSLPPGSTDCTAPPRGVHQELATDRHRRPSRDVHSTASSTLHSQLVVSSTSVASPALFRARPRHVGDLRAEDSRGQGGVGRAHGRGKPVL